MATRSLIWLKIKPDDFGKTLHSDISILPNPIEGEHELNKAVHIPSNPLNDILYLGIYCHWDGYPDGVGKELQNKFNTYEKVLNLILLGDCSSIIEEISPYHIWRGEELIVRRVDGGKPAATEGYNYIFDGESWTCNETINSSDLGTPSVCCLTSNIND